MPKLVDHDQRRDDVATVAARVLAASGLGSLTIRDVAEAGGWSTTMVTHYFANKDELLLHTLEISVRDSIRAIERARRDGVDELRAFVEQALPLDEERASRWRLWIAFWAGAVGSPELAAVQRMRQEHLVELLADALRRRTVGADDPVGEPRRDRAPADPDETARRIVALLDGIAVQATFSPDLWPPERQLAHFADLLDE